MGASQVAPVSSGNTEAKMGTDQRSRHAESTLVRRGI